MDICTQIFVWNDWIIRQVYMLLFKKIFQSEYTILHSHQPCMSVKVAHYHHQRLLLWIFVILAILIGV